MKTENLELAAMLVVSGYPLAGAAINQRGYVSFEFDERAAALVAEFNSKDMAIPSLRQFSEAHKNLRSLVNRLKFERKSEVRGNVNVESQSHR